MVYIANDYDMLKRRGIVDKNKNDTNALIGYNSVSVGSNCRFEVAIRFLTLRDTSNKSDVMASEEIIK